MASGGGFYHIDIRYRLSAEQLKSFQTKLMQDVRISLSNGSVQHEGIKKKNASKIQELAKCIN